MSEQNLKIIGLDISHFKRIRAFHCKLGNEGLVTIGGENAQGKSSVLDAIYAALAGIPKSLTNPVHDGANEAHIRVLIGTGDEVTCKVIRSFDAAGKPRLHVEANGAVIGNPSAFLKEMLGQQAIDPVAFLDMQPIEQRNQLARLLNLDLTSLDQEIRAALDRENELDRHQKNLEAKVSDLPWHPDAPKSEISAAELAQQIQEATRHNMQGQQLSADLTTIQNDRDRAVLHLHGIDADIERLKRELFEKEGQRNRQKAAIDALAEREAQAKAAIEAFQPKDVDALNAQFSEIEATNRKVRENQAREIAAAEWQQAEAELKEAIATRKAKEQAKKDALASATFPVPGLGFAENTITYNGQPFAQASMAERLRVATSIAIAMRGRLAPILIRDASTLDNTSLKMIADMAEQHGVQVFAEIVANQTDEGFDKNCTFYVVEGERAGVEA